MQRHTSIGITHRL